MKELTTTQIENLRDFVQELDFKIDISSLGSFTTRNHEILDISQINTQTGFSFDFAKKQDAIPLNATTKLSVITKSGQLTLFEGVINQIVSIDTNRSSVIVKPFAANVSSALAQDKYQLIARSAGVFCGAIYGNKDTTIPRLVCGATPKFTAITPAENTASSINLKIKENFTRNPISVHRKLMLWSDNNEKTEVLAIAQNVVLLKTAISVNTSSKLYIYDECDYTLNTCTSRKNYQGDPYTANMAENGLDYHSVDYKYDGDNNFNPQITNFDVFNRDLNALRIATTLGDDADSTSKNKSALSDAAVTAIMEEIQNQTNYGMNAVAVAITVYILAQSGGDLTSILIAAPQIYAKVTAMLEIALALSPQIEKLGLGIDIEGLLSSIGGIVSNLSGNDDIWEDYPQDGNRYYGFPENETDWNKTPSLVTYSCGANRSRTFGKTYAMLYPVYKSYKLLKKHHLTEFHTGKKIGPIDYRVDFHIGFDFALATNSYIYGGLDAKDTTVTRLYSRYDLAGTNPKSGSFTPDFGFYSPSVNCEPVISNNEAEQALAQNVSMAICADSYAHRGKTSNGVGSGDATQILSKMAGTKKYAHHLIPDTENLTTDVTATYCDIDGYTGDTTYAYKLLNDAQGAREPLFAPLKNFKENLNTDDVHIEAAYLSVLALQPVLAVQVESIFYQYSLTDTKLAICDAIASERHTILPLACVMAAADLPPIFATETTQTEAIRAQITHGASFGATGAESNAVTAISAQFIT